MHHFIFASPFTLIYIPIWDGAQHVFTLLVVEMVGGILYYLFPQASSRLMQTAEGQVGIMHAAFDEAIKAASHWTSSTVVWFPQQ